MGNQYISASSALVLLQEKDKISGGEIVGSGVGVGGRVSSDVVRLLPISPHCASSPVNHSHIFVACAASSIQQGLTLSEQKSTLATWLPVHSVTISECKVPRPPIRRCLLPSFVSWMRSSALWDRLPSRSGVLPPC